jgi:peptide-methionine (R)-S-oxide reductase
VASFLNQTDNQSKRGDRSRKDNRSLTHSPRILHPRRRDAKGAIRKIGDNKSVMEHQPIGTSTQPLSRSGYKLGPLSAAERDRLAQRLSAEERRVMLDHGTEPPFCGGLLDNKQDGVYACRLCGLPLFRSSAKFESGTGWPSFFEPFDPDHIRTINDTSYGMLRTEIRCRRCDSHQGHVFPDGPPPTRQRFCLNSASMEFFPAGSEPSE